MSETLNPATPAQIERDDSKAKGMSMDKIKGLVPLFTGGILLMAIASFMIISLSVVFTWSNSRFNKLETGQANLEKRMDKLEIRMENLEAGQAKILTILEKIKSQSSKK